MNNPKIVFSTARLNKLKSYAALSTAFLAIYSNGNSQVVYQDVNPDLNVFLDDVPLDINGDGSNDFKLVFLSESFASFAPNELKVRINPLGDNQIAYSFQTIPITYSGSPYATYFGGATQILFTNVPVLNEGDLVNADLDFHLNIGVLYEKLFFYIYSSYNVQPFIGGNWNGVTDHFAAIKLYNDDTDAYHFGWMRLSVNAETGIILKDYAFELSPETPITTAINQYSIEWITAGDFGITGTASDLQFNFNAAGDEADITTYKVICVKSTIDDFDVTTADALPADRYVEIIPDGSVNYAQAFPEISYDSDGDLIIAGQEYKLFVLNVMQPAINYANILSTPTNNFTLLNIVETANDLSLADINNYGNGTDIRINFNPANTEQGIAEYRICITQKDAADLFTLDDALLLSADRYTVVLPGAENYEVFLPADALDTDGNTIQPNRYKAFIVSMPDGTTVNVPSITLVSNVVLLEMETAVVNAPLLADIAETGTGSDISIIFSNPAFEQTVETYRVFLVDFAAAFDFNLAAAQLSLNFIEIIPNETDIEIIGDATMVDSEGNPITWGVPYYAYILAVAGEFGINDTLSAPSNQLILNFPVIIDITSTNNFQPQIFATYNAIQINLNQESSNAQFRLLDLTGRIIIEQQLTQTVTTIPVDVTAGTYLIQVIDSNKYYNCKIVLGN